MTHLPSGSALERAFACPPSQAYPGLKSLSGLRWTLRGTTLHAFLVRVAEVGREAALEEVPARFYDDCACIDTDRLPPATPDSYAYEVAFAYNLRTGEARELGRNVGRQVYVNATKDEVVGTLDVLGMTEDYVIVLDYKTGFRFYSAVEENEQLLFGALAACRAYGRERAWVAIIRIDEEGHPYFLWGEVTAEQLEAFARRLVDLDATIGAMKLELSAGGELQPVTGDHCQYCPAVWCCPGWQKLARVMTSPEDDLPGLPPLTAETGPLYVEALKRGKKVLERLERAVNLYAEQEPIDMGGEWVYGKHPYPRTVWDVEKALPILSGYLSAEEAASTLKAEILKGKIADVYRARKKLDRGVGIKKSTETIVEALKNQGACSTRYTFPFGVFKPKPEDAELMEQAAGQKSLTVGGDANGEARLEEEAGQRNGDAPGEAGG